MIFGPSEKTIKKHTEILKIMGMAQRKRLAILYRRTNDERSLNKKGSVQLAKDGQSFTIMPVRGQGEEIRAGETPNIFFTIQDGSTVYMGKTKITKAEKLETTMIFNVLIPEQIMQRSERKTRKKRRYSAGKSGIGLIARNKSGKIVSDAALVDFNKHGCRISVRLGSLRSGGNLQLTFSWKNKEVTVIGKIRKKYQAEEGKDVVGIQFIKLTQGINEALSTLEIYARQG